MEYFGVASGGHSKLGFFSRPVGDVPPSRNCFVRSRTWGLLADLCIGFSSRSQLFWWFAGGCAHTNQSCWRIAQVDDPKCDQNKRPPFVSLQRQAGSFGSIRTTPGAPSASRGTIVCQSRVLEWHMWQAWNFWKFKTILFFKGCFSEQIFYRSKDHICVISDSIQLHLMSLFDFPWSQPRIGQ